MSREPVTFRHSRSRKREEPFGTVLHGEIPQEHSGSSRPPESWTIVDWVAGSSPCCE